MSAPARKTVLVIDDDRDFREALEAALDHEGFDVLHAANARDGVTLALAELPDVVLLDHGLPDGRGTDALTELRARGFERPVVILSGSADRPGLRHPGADHVLHKPVDYDQLCAVLKAASERGAPP
jgi:two-component system KDP operon response regulator KdpE